tara:strand:+ start:1436 stop:1735 length:300 start_codon:yes stop_codon:yes gene_type:complete
MTFIDTDKYEGHTPGPWEWWNNYISEAYGNEPHIAKMEYDYKEEDAILITDAPLLLEEVKRWHKVRDYILEKSSYPTVKKLNLKDLLNFMEEVFEGGDN